MIANYRLSPKEKPPSENRMDEFFPFRDSFLKRLDNEMRTFQIEADICRQFFHEPRHTEDIRGTMEDEDDEKDGRRFGKERMKTVSVAIIMCLHIGIDPPDAPKKPENCARKLAWIDPKQQSTHKAAGMIANSLQKSYERWQPRAKYKLACDPPLDDVRKITTNLRRVSGTDRILFHYNGHGVPKPTDNGEIWVFNKSFTQYIPLSLYDLQSWMEFPAIYVWESHSAETIIDCFQRFAEDHEKNWQKEFDLWQERSSSGLPPISSNMDQAQQADVMGFPTKKPKYHECIHLAACRKGQFLPFSDPNMPADLFTSCLTSPVQTGILWYLHKSGRKNEFPPNVLDNIPGQLNERRTVLGELNWIFTAITDTIAFTAIERDVFQKLFRQDLLLASLFRSFLLAQRVMGDYNVQPISWPEITNTATHELWACWDSTLDMVLDYVREEMYGKYSRMAVAAGRTVMIKSNVFPFLTLIDFDAYINVNDPSSNWFFSEQLQAFELWLDYGVDRGKPPLQLPVVLQVLLSQQHRVRALKLLARFLDFGRWAVGYSLSVGIFPYVLRLLQSHTRDLRPWLAFIWAKILAVDPSCQPELFKENLDDAGMSAPSTHSAGQIKANQMHVQRLQNTGSQNDMGSGERTFQTGGRFQSNHSQMQEYQQQYAQQQYGQQQGTNAYNRSPSASQPTVTTPKAPQVVKKTSNTLRYNYFISMLNCPDITPLQKVVPAFVLAMLTHNNYKKAQEHLTERGFVNLCTEVLCDPNQNDCRLLKMWILIGMGRLWSDYNDARWQAVRLVAYQQVIRELDDKAPEVRAAAVFALGSLIKNSSLMNEHAAFIDQQLADEICNKCTYDGSTLVREELIVALQWFVFDFEKRFVKLLFELSKQCKLKIPKKDEANTEEDEGFDIASRMPSMSKSRFLDMTMSDYGGSILSFEKHKKKMPSSSMFSTDTEEKMRRTNSTLSSYSTVSDKTNISTTYNSEDLEFIIRTMAQIKHLEAKPFNEPIARTWLSILRLALDPMQNIARMAQKIVLRVESGTHQMKDVINVQITKMQQKEMERKTSKVGVDMMRGGNNSTMGISEMARNQLIAQHQKVQEVKMKEKGDRVKFQVGSPSEIPVQTYFGHNNEAITITSPSNTSLSSDRESDRPTSKITIAVDGRSEGEESTASKGSTCIPADDIMDAMAKSFTPKRRTVGEGNFTKEGESATLRKVIDDPIVTTQFVPWCSRIFVEPILHLLYRDLESGKEEVQEEVDDAVLTKTCPSDFAIHAQEGMEQSAEMECNQFMVNKFDNCLWRVKLHHSVTHIATSKIRRTMYATDGRQLTVIRQNADPRTFRRFDLTAKNPFCQDRVTQIMLINEMAREMIMCCSSSGVVRIWDPCFTSFNEDYEKPPKLMTAAYPLYDQQKMSDAHIRCLYDWNQSSGRLMLTGHKSVRIWDAHYEKTMMDIPYSHSAGTGKHEKKLSIQPTALSGDLDFGSDLVSVGYGDGIIDVFDIRMPRHRAMRLCANGGVVANYETGPPSGVMHLQLRKSGSGQNYLFTGNTNGLITTWEPRMYTEPISTIQAPWQKNGHVAMSVHRTAKFLVSASETGLRMYDINGRQIAKIAPPVETHDHLNNNRNKSKRTVPEPRITALETQQIRMMACVGYDDNTIRVYGANNPGLGITQFQSS